MEEVRHRGARRAAARPTGGRAGEGGEESRRAERTRNGAGDLDLKWERQERETQRFEWIERWWRREGVDIF
jgi:hypothetical protein